MKEGEFSVTDPSRYFSRTFENSDTKERVPKKRGFPEGLK
jgi:hypothetical protein